MTESGAREPTLGDELRALEEIVRRLEAEGTDLDEALKLFEDGVARLRRARARIAEAERSVQAVLEDADGSLRLQDVDL